MSITYRIAKVADIETIAKLSSELHSPPYTNDEDLTYEECVEIHTEEILDDDYAFFIAFSKDEAIGFSYVSYRREYVDGTDGDGTTGYLEGIYIKSDYNGRGIARILVDMCEDWSREKGCKEFASSCLIDNHDSLAFHLKIGFEETLRVIHFAKLL